MDLLFRRYADPFLMADQMLQGHQFSNFVTKLYELENENQIWEYYLHKVFDKSFTDFKHSLRSTGTTTKKEIKDTIKDSFALMQEFRPERGESSGGNRSI